MGGRALVAGTFGRLVMKASFGISALALMITAAPAFAQSATSMEAAKATAAAPVPAAPAQAASTPATGLPLMTGTNADLIGNAADPAGTQRGSVGTASSNLPNATTASNPTGAPIPSVPVRRY